MKPISADELRPITEYETLRRGMRRDVIRLKQDRRFAVGGLMSLVFENRDTVLFQIQEMIRVEQIEQPEAVQHEVDTYNELIPGAHELSATMFIEVTEAEHARDVLDFFVGLPQSGISLGIGTDEIRAVFDLDQSSDTRVSAVQYLRFPLGEALARRFCDTAQPVWLAIDHHGYTHRVAIEGAARASLMEDLRA
ncbi:MAG: DUF3501 family protein [Ignavibacteriae bacterium]|nr:DUF3501 family protein [Ignavibacteriota bacterium]